MKFVDRLKHFSALSLLSSLSSSVVYAHPGHIADESVHSLLHIEHIIALVAVGAVVYTVLSLRRK